MREREQESDKLNMLLKKFDGIQIGVADEWAQPSVQFAKFSRSFVIKFFANPLLAHSAVLLNIVTGIKIEIDFSQMNNHWMQSVWL